MAEELFAVYSGGVFNLDSAGYTGDNDDGYRDDLGQLQGVGSGSGGSGGGHGGTGGRGAGRQPVGLGYDSIYTPTQHGAPGGFGSQLGQYS